MKTGVFILIAFLITTESNAQSPGYFGKHFGLYADFGISPAFYKWTADDYEDPSLLGYEETVPNIGAKIFPGITGELTLSKGLSLGAEFKYFQRRDKLHYDSSDGLEGNDYHVFFGESTVKANMIGGYLKFYSFNKKGSISPIGKYNAFGFIYASARKETGKLVITDPDAIVTLAMYYYGVDQMDDDIPVANIEDLNYPNIPIVLFKYAFGSENIVFDKFIMDLNMQLTLPINILQDYLIDYSVVPEGYSQYTGDINDDIWIGTFLNINIGFGGMLF